MTDAEPVAALQLGWVKVNTGVIGVGLTTTLMLSLVLLHQPLLSVMVTEYVPVLVALSELLVEFPMFHW